MGAGESKLCTSCEKEIKSRQVQPQCHFCKKVVCTDCSNREAPGTNSSSKVRVCHVCKVNRMNRESDQGPQVVMGKPKKFEKVISVDHDNKTGTFSGLPTIWRDLLELPLSNSKNEINTSNLDASIAPVQPSKRIQYVIKEKNAEGAYIISAPQIVEKTFQVRYDKKLKRLVGLPKGMEHLGEGFEEHEIDGDMGNVLDAIGAAARLEEDQVQPLPSESDFTSELGKAAHFSLEDPSKFYEIVKKIGYGGFARVFLVKRKEDGKMCALKFIEPKNPKEREIIKNELGIMQMCKENDNVIQCFEAFDYRQRLWIFLEFMDGGCLTPIVEERKGNISEGVCSYILY